VDASSPQIEKCTHQFELRNRLLQASTSHEAFETGRCDSPDREFVKAEQQVLADRITQVLPEPVLEPKLDNRAKSIAWNIYNLVA